MFFYVLQKADHTQESRLIVSQTKYEPKKNIKNIIYVKQIIICNRIHQENLDFWLSIISLRGRGEWLLNLNTLVVYSPREKKILRILLFICI